MMEKTRRADQIELFGGASKERIDIAVHDCRGIQSGGLSFVDQPRQHLPRNIDRRDVATPAQ
jgi:hypothetical protein